MKSDLSPEGRGGCWEPSLVFCLTLGLVPIRHVFYSLTSELPIPCYSNLLYSLIILHIQLSLSLLNHFAWTCI